MEKRAGIVEKIDMLQEALEPIVQILSNPEVSEHIESQTGKDHNLLEYLTTNHGVGADHVIMSASPTKHTIAVSTRDDRHIV